MKDTSEPLLTLEELAKELRVHPRTLYRLGKLPSIKVGKRVRRYRLSEVVKHLEEKC